VISLLNVHKFGSRSSIIVMYFVGKLEIVEIHKDVFHFSVYKRI
jgi:hypothetical protein